MRGDILAPDNKKLCIGDSQDSVPKIKKVTANVLRSKKMFNMVLVKEKRRKQHQAPAVYKEEHNLGQWKFTGGFQARMHIDLLYGFKDLW